MEGSRSKLERTPKLFISKRKSIGALEKNQRAKETLFRTSSLVWIASEDGIFLSKPKIVAQHLQHLDFCVEASLCGGGKATAAVLSWRVRRARRKSIETFDKLQSVSRIRIVKKPEPIFLKS